MRLAALTLILAWSALAPVPASAQIQGAWSPEIYALEDGTELPVSGLIFFTDTDWTVLFFVVDADGKPVRGAGEGGAYELEGDRLTLRHSLHLSVGDAVASLQAAPLRMNVVDPADAATEPCRIEHDGDALTIHFPSGNRMDFRRSSNGS